MAASVRVAPFVKRASREAPGYPQAKAIVALPQATDLEAWEDVKETLCELPHGPSVWLKFAIGA